MLTERLYFSDAKIMLVKYILGDRYGRKKGVLYLSILLLNLFLGIVM